MTTVAPPDVPAGITDPQADYLRRLALWGYNEFGKKLDIKTATPGVLLQSSPSNNVYQLSVDDSGGIETRSVTLASGKLGTPIAGGGGGAPGPPGPAGPAGPSAVSAQSGNIAVIASSDHLIYVPAAPVQSVATRTGAVTLTHTDITDWTATLAPYALTTSVPVASSTTPAMDGTAAVGTGTTWARADHVHPTDTSRYAASNPSNYQTAAQVTAALAPYALIAGVTNGSDAPAGSVGEYMSNNATGVAVTTGTNTSVCSITLTPGDWDVEGVGYLSNTGANITAVLVWVAGGSPTNGAYDAYTGPALTTRAAAVSAIRYNVTASTAIGLHVQASFTAGTTTAQGMIRARRVR